MISSNSLPITPEMLVSDLLERWPQAIPVLVSHRTHCVGCLMSRFDTLRDVMGNYGISWPLLLNDLERAIRTAPLSQPDEDCFDPSSKNHLER